MSASPRREKRYKPKLIRITFEEGHKLEDLEVRMRPASVDDLLDLMKVADLAKDVADGSAVVLTDEHKQAVTAMVAKVADLVVWWNADDIVTGEPVAPDEAGMRAQDFSMVFAIFEAFFDQVAAVAPPLPHGSPNGSGPHPVIPMETLAPASQLS